MYRDFLKSLRRRIYNLEESFFVFCEHINFFLSVHVSLFMIIYIIICNIILCYYNDVIIT